jgi:hypothetical protein
MLPDFSTGKITHLLEDVKLIKVQLFMMELLKYVGFSPTVNLGSGLFSTNNLNQFATRTLV